MTAPSFDIEKEAKRIAVAGWHEGLESLERNIVEFGRRCRNQTIDEIASVICCCNITSEFPNHCINCTQTTNELASLKTRKAEEGGEGMNIEGFKRYIALQRIVGEMAGSLRVVESMCKCEIRKEGIKELLKRYEEFFSQKSGARG